MIAQVNFCDFTDAFKSMGRKDQFSYDGLKVLFAHLEDWESDLGSPLELDVIALCCEWVEEPIQDALENYDLETLEALEDATTVLRINDETIVYQSY